MQAQTERTDWWAEIGIAEESGLVGSPGDCGALPSSETSQKKRPFQRYRWEKQCERKADVM